MTESTPPEPAPGPGLRSNEEELLAFIQNRDVPCPHCQYNVRNLARPVCPECGTKLFIHIGYKEQYWTAWATLMASGSSKLM